MPKRQIKRKHVFNLTLNEEEREALDRIAAWHGCSRSKALRAMIVARGNQIAMAPGQGEDPEFDWSEWEKTLRYQDLVNHIWPQNNWLLEPEDLPKIDALVASLPHTRERRVIQAHYGLGGWKWKGDQHGPMTLTAISKEFGVTLERIRQLESRGLRWLRHPRRLSMLEKQPDS